MTYYIFYGNDVDFYDADSLEKAKAHADRNATYGRDRIMITTETTLSVCREWHDEPYTGGCTAPIVFGSGGYYGDWHAF